ncbi:acyltransferase family protein [Amycolatopsis cihanbeyliensis]|uniref:Fucose 4-O-acetylase-like acetyltransferase n=1 Tax=Amycolatopsis cihanbeyliensis TaxID=1128664 RepID=A0A542DPI5_AMYCI|nr:fucose 4-O-acetylase-like acetyltransferase [Amycolatopsis cihanbeyliensis]
MRSSQKSPVRRDSFLDVVRAVAIVAVVGQHWIMPVLGYQDAHLATGNALATPGWWVVTWLSQVMPLVFFAGGAANLLSLRRAPTARDWLGGRVQRLLLPVLPLMAVWLAVPPLLRGFGVPEQPVEVAGTIAAQLLWFLAVYLPTVLLTPLLAEAHRRWGLAVPVVLTGAAVLVDIARFSDIPLVGYANALFVWLAVHQLGFHYAEGRLGRLGRGAAVGVAAAGFGSTALLVAFGPYPASMIGMPGAPVSNMSPPTALLVSLAVGQVGLLLAVRPALNRLATTPVAGAALRWLGPRFMSIYLWHMPALVCVAGVAVLGLGYATPEPGTLRWLAMIPLWVAAAAAVLGRLLRLFGRFESMPLSSSARPAPVWRSACAGLLGATGLLGLAAGGFSTPEGGTLADSPVPWVALVLAAFLLARRVEAEQTGGRVVQHGTEERPAEPVVGRPAGDRSQLPGVGVRDVREVGAQHHPVGDPRQ